MMPTIADIEASNDPEKTWPQIHHPDSSGTSEGTIQGLPPMSTGRSHDRSLRVSLRISVGPLAEEDFAACRDQCAREPKFQADILAPFAHRVRLAAKVLPGRKKLP